MSTEPILASLLPDTAKLDEHDVHIGGVSLKELAATYGTPLFVYDEATLRARCAEAAARLRRRGGVRVQVILMWRDGAAGASRRGSASMSRRGVSSTWCCVRGSTPPGLFCTATTNCPVNSNAPSRWGCTASWWTISTRSSDWGIWSSAARPLHCLIRVTPGVEAHTHEFVRTGQEDTKFGFSLASGDARRAIGVLRGMPHVTLHGVHAHIGSQIFDTAGFDETVKVSGGLHRAMTTSTSSVSAADSGVAYVEGESTLSHHPVGSGRSRGGPRGGARPQGADHGRAGTRDRGASGRDDVHGGGRQGGHPAHLHGGGRWHERQPSSRALRFGLRGLRRRPSSRAADPECAPRGSSLRERRHLDRRGLAARDATGVGSLIATPVTGAYGYSMASNYNRVARPAVVFVAEGAARDVLRRETFDDLARLEV